MANERNSGWTGQPPGDWGQGRHVGKGPKGYRRSDERIREDVGDLLERHPEIDASDIELHVSEGVVALSGTVEDRRTKRLAEDVAETVAGVRDVENRLRITRGRLDEALDDLSASGATMGRGTIGAGGPMPPTRAPRGQPERRPPARKR